MSSDIYDCIVIGSGAGGAAAAYTLASRGKRVLLLEKGKALPLNSTARSGRRVLKWNRLEGAEIWLDGRGHAFHPDEAVNVGGKTKWYGAALLRMAPHEFEPDDQHQCLAWPFGYGDLEPYYEQAETLLSVTAFANEPHLQALVDGICRDDGWRVKPLQLAIRPEILKDDYEARHFDGFASTSGYKCDAENSLLARLAGLPNFTLLADRPVVALCSAARDPARIEGVICADGTHYHAKAVVLAANAMNTPRLLQDHLANTGLAGRLPAADLIGAYYKHHLITSILTFVPRRNADVLRKTAMFLNDRYPHTSVQCRAWLDTDTLADKMPHAVPKALIALVAPRANLFFVMTEDGSHARNKVLSGGRTKPAVLDYDQSRLEPAQLQHSAAVRDFSRRLLTRGIASVRRRVGIRGTAHALGTMIAGHDPATSVVDPDGKVHGMEGLYVADGSPIPRSGRVNPALTIFAWGLRVGDRLAATM